MIDRVQLQDFVPLPGEREQFSLSFMEEYSLVKLAVREGITIVGCLSEPDSSLKSRLEFSVGSALRFVEIDRPEYTEYLSRRAAELTAEAPSSGRIDTNLLDKLANDAPIVNLVNSILLEGIRKGCSDIHLEAQAEGLRVRFRIDGLLETSRTLPRDIAEGLASRIKIMSNLNIIERRLPQDGKMTAVVGGASVEFRVSIVPTVEGESIVLRLFNRDEGDRELEALGFSDMLLSDLRSLMKTPNGLILVTGPTGSGKTTTLNAVLSELNTPEVKILTIEDPVENRIQGLCQIQTNDDIGMTFDSILRRLLRQDPDILMIGEIRDRATADLALRSALTGHQVWATLHTNDALAAVDRLLNMGLEPYLLAGVVRGVMAQRLVRRLCPKCAVKVIPDPAESDFIEKQGADIRHVWKAVGCDECTHGYKGRVALGELFILDSETEELIVHGGSHRRLEEHFQQIGTRFMADSGIELIASGITTIADIERMLYGI